MDSDSGLAKVLRLCRVLRPLRALHLLPGLRTLVSAVLTAASRLAEVLVLCLAILCLRWSA
jgi:hypothetical protein